MLPPGHRLTSPTDFREVVRRGRRSGSTTLVTHVLLAPDAPAHPGPPARVGFVVSKAVGGAVVRNRVKRRLRHLVRDRVTQLPPGCRVVVRALPPAAEVTYADLGDQLDRSLSRSLDRVPAGTR